MLAYNNAAMLPKWPQNIIDRMEHVIIFLDKKTTDDSLKVACDHFGNKVIIEDYLWPDDYAEARNDLITAARAYGDDYVLMADSDDPMTGTIPDELVYEYYGFMLVDQVSKISWWNKLMFHKDLPVKYEGKIHEYCNTGTARGLGLPTAIVQVYGSSGGKERWRNFDLPVLLDWLYHEPRNPRCALLSWRNMQKP